MTDTDIAAILALLRKVAAEIVMPHFRNLAPGMVHEKSGPLDIVTIADEAAETALAAGLTALFPGTAIVGEEASAANPALIATLASGSPAFVIDPIDGTANYAAGVPLFGIMIALVVNERPIAAFIHDPICDDTAIAIRGHGAWIETRAAQRRPLRAAQSVPLASTAALISWRFLPQSKQPGVLAALPRIAASWDFRCAAHQYRLLAAGGAHTMLFGRTLPWDHAAGSLLFEEAGGYAARLDGTPWRASDPAGGILLAPDEASWRALSAVFFPR